MGSEFSRSAISVYHSADGSKRFEVLIGNGQQLWTNTYLLSSMETKAISINEIVEKQIPDADGKVLAKDILTGQAGWYTHRAKWGKGRLMISQPQSGLARSFSCGNCAALCLDAFLQPYSSAFLGIQTTAPLGAVTVNQCLATCGQCGGKPQGPGTGVYSWSSSNSSISSVSAGSHAKTATFLGVGPGLANGNFTVTDEGCQAQGGGPINVVRLTCTPGAVTRAGSVSCTVSAPSGSTFSNWKFTDGSGNTVTGNGTSSTWSGVMVTSGAVSVTVKDSSGNITTPSQPITVNARSWHTSPASAAPVPNGTFFQLPVPPQPAGTDSGLGEFKEDTSNSPSPNSTIIGADGPNTGYAYFATQLSISTLFQYEINPDLQSSTSQFSTHQWGACGYISWSNLLTQTNRHEFNSSTQSHYAFYTTSINSNANNPGDFFEQQVAPPGADLIAFRNAVNSGLVSRYNQTFAATSVEPFAVNYSETGTFLGNINYAPYATCP